MKEMGHTAVRQGFKLTQIGITGFWLLALYPVLLWLILATLSGYGFQEKVGQIKDEHTHQVLTIPAVMRQAAQLREIEARESLLETQLDAARAQAAQAHAARLRSVHQLTLAQSRADDLRRQIMARLTYLYQKAGINEGINLDTIAEGIERFGNDPKLTEFLPEYRQRTAALAAAEAEDKLNAGKETERNDGVAIAKIALGETRTEALDLIQKAHIGDVISELEYLDTFHFKAFATMPSQLLTLILTLAMGALGSLICITLDYFLQASEHPFSWYLFRPFLGMVTAVAMFILAKAGQLTISGNPASLSISENLNPFVISFLGIISGLLSEQATERIRNAGQVVFRTNEEKGPRPERWAVGLSAEMEGQKKNADDLLPFVDASRATVTAWINETQAVPWEAQQVIAAWLGIPARVLFTDIAPAHPDEEDDL